MDDQRIVRRSLLGGVDPTHGGGATCVCSKPVHRFGGEGYGDVGCAQLGSRFEQMSCIGACLGEKEIPIFKKGLPSAAEYEPT